MKFAVAFTSIFFATQVNAAEMVVKAGAFHGGNYAPNDTASGGVAVLKLENGSYQLRLATDFSTTPGPDLFVYLSTSVDPKDDVAVTTNDFVNAGRLASPSGSQILNLPESFDPIKFNSVVIWCKQFGVLFGAATLAKQ